MAQPSEIEKLERRYAENPKGRNFAPLADAYRKAGQVDQAIELCKSGLERHPDYVSAHIVYGRCLIDKHTDSAAEQVFRKVLELDPENVIAFRVLAEISQRGGRLDEAVGWLTKLLAADPMNGDAAEALTVAKSKAAQAAQAAKASAPAPAPASPAEQWIVATAPEPEASEPAPVAPPEPGIVALDTISLEPPAPGPLAAAEQPSGDFEVFDGTVNFSSASHTARADGIELQEEVVMEPTEIAVEGLARTQYEGSGIFKVDKPAQPAEVEAPAVDLPLFMPEDVTPAAPEPAPSFAAPSPPPPVRRGTPVPAAVALSDDDGAADAVALSRAEPVLTETMAELYLKQGHRDEALRVYRALEAQRPNDARLRAKVAALSGGQGEGGRKSGPAATGQSAQAFLRGILAGRPGSGRAPEPAASSPLESAFATTLPDAEPRGAPTRAAADNISLGELFGDEGTGSADASAGSREAFAAPAAPETAAPASPTGFSFDEFFAAAGAPAADTTPAAPNPPPRPSAARTKPAHEEEDRDLDQFQAWLKGLKS